MTAHYSHDLSILSAAVLKAVKAKHRESKSVQLKALKARIRRVKLAASSSNAEASLQAGLKSAGLMYATTTK